ncbi:MAG: hypothetical protein A3B31_03675 [Candidatus Komeilibacteria bacterium RIFCSPLOWO2_01_FULL_53_11]|uniref:Uncharacterized protein n=1 Tax=Candidatus Komeilibacteria bacterium RIFCSPLOWO2_01_FULL_53_11 TaxID=1798552 RepID=A0A1G2BNM7_9BACT|nr:MAG: hypothetical protein A3B31_03675 [Candidatus Komeilibacteria bacterium RIFCSPLOWO2_01_FULL_53_11]
MLLVAVLSIFGIFIILMQVKGASSTLFSFTINDPSTASPVTSEPPAAITIPGASYPVAYLGEENTTPETAPEVPSATLRMKLTLTDGSIPEGGTATNAIFQNKIPAIADRRPVFSGTTGIPHTLVFLELQRENGLTITSSIETDDAGEWRYMLAEDFADGLHTAHATVFTPDGGAILGTVFLQFTVGKPALPSADEAPLTPTESSLTAEPRTTVYVPRSLLEQRQVLFDIRAEIIGENKSNEIHPGDELFVQITLLNIGSPGYLVDSTVGYRLLDAAGNEYLNEKETVSVSTQTSYLKRFKTKPTMPEGRYRLEAVVEYADTEALSYANFSVTGVPVIALPGGVKADATILIQILTMTFAIAVFIAYLEHREVELLGKMIHQVSEEDLQKSGLIS